MVSSIWDLRPTGVKSEFTIVPAADRLASDKTMESTCDVRHGKVACGYGDAVLAFGSRQLGLDEIRNRRNSADGP